MIIALKEKSWFDGKADYRMWDQLCRSMGEKFQLVSSFDEAEFPEGAPIVIMDESADIDLQDFKHPENAVYVFGRTGLNNMQEQFYSDYAVKIATKEKIPQFGVVAAGIVLYDRMIKNGNNNI